MGRWFGMNEKLDATLQAKATEVKMVNGCDLLVLKSSL